MHRAAWPLTFLVACSAAEPAPTWYADVEPILQSRCLSCHVSGGIAPLSFETREDAERYAGAIADAVEQHRMPPGQTNPACADYAPSPNLTDAQVATISAWAAADAPAGDPADEVETAPQVDPFALDRVDMEARMPVAYTPHNAPDDYRCFPIEWPADRELYVTGFGVEPGNEKIVHHVILYAIPPASRDIYLDFDAAEEGPGYTCFGGPGGASPTNRLQWIGGWSPGQTGRVLPAGTGMPVEPGSLAILEVHYYVGNDPAPAPDQSTVLLRLDEEVEHVGSTFPIADPLWVFGHTMEIPDGSEALDVRYAYTIQEPSHLHEVGMHMHRLGVGGSVRVHHASGGDTCAIQIDNWDFNWQRSYRLQEPIALAPGDQVEVTCTYTNHTGATVNWGESTDAEMCIGVTYLTEDG